MKNHLPVIVLIAGLVALTLGCNPSSSDTKTSYAGFPYSEMTIEELQKGYAEGKFTVRQVTEGYLERIQNIDKSGPELNSLISTNPHALKVADSLDQELQEGFARGPLHGIPVILKDNIDTENIATTAGSRALEGSYPDDDAFLTRKLKQAGAIVLAKANLSEWANFRGAMSTSGWSGLGGQVKNPYVLDRNPCGSSSGSGVAVSANLCMVAIGTETNGSIVCPSHANGVVGIKPTVGLISRDGIIPISFTQDTPGPMTRTVTDGAIALGALAGLDSADSKTLAGKDYLTNDYTQFLNDNGLEGKRIGIFTEALGQHYKVDSVFNRAVAFMESQGAEFVEIEQIASSRAGYYSFEIMLYEYKDGLNKYFSSLGEDAPIKSVAELIEFNKTDSLELKYFAQNYLEEANRKAGLESEDYKNKLEQLMKLSRESGLDSVMDANKLDAIVAPTGSPAWKTDWINGDHYQLGSSSPAARAGYPNITVPMGFIGDLPVGISIFGRAWSEPVLLEIAYAYEQGTLHRKEPQFLDQDFQ